MLFVWIILPLSSKACDVCGCIAGGSYNGILPQYQTNFMGYRIQYNSFMHPNTDLNKNYGNAVLEDQYKSQELWFRYFPQKRVQLFFSVPYKINSRIDTKTKNTIQGIGDLSVQADYILFNNGDSANLKWKNRIFVGAGIRLPTGKYQQRDINKVMMPAVFQVGSGAYSYSLHLLHTIRYKAVGINTNIQYAYNTKNELEFDYGNQFATTVSFFYWKKAKNFSILPNIGMSYETSQKNSEYGIIDNNSGGQTMLANIGLDMYFKKMGLNVFVQKPVYQNIGVSQPSNNIRVGLGLLFFLEKKMKTI